jgi:arylsulfatase A-like enzyme
LFTGLWPQQHGTISKEAVLPAQAVTMAEELRAQGYHTAAIVANGNISNVYGFSQGFSFYRYIEGVLPGQPVARSTEINEAVIDWLDENGANQPFFLYIHTVDPHVPYGPPEPYRSRFAGESVDPEFGSAEQVQALGKDPKGVTDDIVDTLVNLYDGEVAANDAAFGRLVDELKTRDLYDDSVVIFLSDHGEEFFDHRGWTHGNTLHGEVLSIPLIIKLPGMREGSTIDHIVDHVDLFATILDLGGAEAQPVTMGQSLLPLCRGEGEGEWPEEAMAHLDLKERLSVSRVEGRWKLILRRRGRRDRVPELYDRFADRHELLNLVDQDPVRVKAMRGRLEESEKDCQDILGGSLVDVADDEEMKEKLRVLGYVQD